MRPIRVMEEASGINFSSADELALLLRSHRVQVGALLGRPIRGSRRAPPWHCGVLVGNDAIVSLGLGGVVVETVAVFSGGEAIVVLRQPAAGDAVAARARSRVGARLYRLTFHCIDFANWCAGV